MTEPQAKADAAKHYDMSQWLKGCKDAGAGIAHECGGTSYNAGYSFGVFSQEQASGVYG